jgi:hypothetical protein
LNQPAFIALREFAGHFSLDVARQSDTFGQTLRNEQPAKSAFRGSMKLK